MAKVTVYPSSMSDWNHQLLGELAEPYRVSEKVPELITVSGLTTVDGKERWCTVQVDLYNWKFVVEGVSSKYYDPISIPADVLQRADQVGTELMERFLGITPKEQLYYSLQSICAA